MAKDPAFLFYPGDWQGGTTTMSRFLKGCYLDLLVAQFNSGPLSLEEIRTVLGADFGQSWPSLQKKFKTANGLFFNERLEVEKSKRSAYSESRRNNRKKSHDESYDTTHDKSYVPHMENENENRNVIEKGKGVQGENQSVEDWHLAEVNQAIENSFTPAYIRRLQTEGFEAFPGVDFGLQLKQFKLKVRGSPSKYSNHGLGLRQAFELQIRNAKPTTSNGTNHSTRKQEQLNDLLADHIATYGGSSSGGAT